MQSTRRVFVLAAIMSLPLAGQAQQAGAGFVGEWQGNVTGIGEARLIITGVKASGEVEGRMEFGLQSFVSTFGDKADLSSNDFLQYWLGSYSRADNGGFNDDGTLRRFLGVGDPLAGFTGELDGADSAQNQAAGGLGPATHLITSSVLPADTHPDFASEQGATWEGAGQFTARTGTWFMHSQVVDQGYKRLTRTIDLTGQSTGSLEFYNYRGRCIYCDMIQQELATSSRLVL